MGYDETLADRLRDVLEPQDGVSEKRMFGGLAFLVHGHMACAASSQGGLMLRVDPEQSPTFVEEPGVTLFEMNGRKLAGWLHLDSSAITQDSDLGRWVEVGVSFAESLPPK